MIKLEFNIFQEKLKFEQMNGTFPTIHCKQDNDRFIFVIKTKDKWEYYTEMLFETLINFANSQEQDVDEAFDMFIINYCTNTLVIEEVDIIEIRREINASKIQLIPPEDQNNTVANLSISSPLIKNSNTAPNLVEEAKGYSDFLLKFFDNLEKSVLKATKKLDKSYTEKTMGDFLRDMFNTVNTFAFAQQVKKYIRQDLINGLSLAEKELNQDIGFTNDFEKRLNQLVEQQIDGYTIQGRKWPGIKGVTKEIQAEVIKTVQAGLNENLSLNDIKDNIQNKFDNFSDWRANMIARTETTNIVNEGKLLGYKESGMKGGKIVLVALDNRTTDICRRMHEKYGNNPIPLDEPFVDSKTLRVYQRPAFHVNCRSTIAFRVEK